MIQKRLSEYNGNNAQNCDWAFASANTTYMTHGLHSYPARMIPQIARRLILKYSQEHDLVWDPFCGSGSVLVESMLLSRRSIGTDLNPYAVFLSRVKTTPIKSSVLKRVNERILKEVESLQISTERRSEIPQLPNIDYWFKPYVQADLAAMLDVIESIKESKTRQFLKLCFALTVREVSNLKKREFKIVRIKQPKLDKFHPDVFSSFKTQLLRCTALMDDFTSNIPLNPRIPEIFEADNRNSPIEPHSIDLVVTSPPYGDHSTTVAYGQFSRYPALWIGLDPDSVMTVDRRGLGGQSKREYNQTVLNSKAFHKSYRAVKKRSEKRAKQYYNFVFELHESLKSIYEKIKPSKRACIVVGNRLMSRVRIPTNQIIAELGNHLGLKHELTIPRKIPTKRMPWRNAPENIEGELADTMHTEHIIILKKT